VARRVYAVADRSRVVVRGTGRQDRFTWDAASARYVAPPGVFDTLIQHSDGTTSLTSPHGMREIYDVNGVLTQISADLTREPQTNQAYYVVRASLPEAEIRRLADIKLIPGMPAEAFIQTHERTPLQYLLKPLRDQIARTFRER